MKIYGGMKPCNCGSEALKMDLRPAEMKPKKRRGRPRSKNPATEIIRFRVTKDEKARYRRVAENCDLTVSAWLKRLADLAS